MPVLLRMAVLVPQPGFPPRRLVAAVPQHRVPGDQAVVGQARDQAAQPEREPRDGVVEADHDDAARPRQRHDPGERGARVGRVVQHARRIDHVKGALPQPGPPQVRLDELDPCGPEPPRRSGAQLERPARQVRAHDQPLAARQIEAGLARAAAHLHDAGVVGNGVVEQSGEVAPLGAGAQPLQAVAGRVPWKGSIIIERPDRVGAAIGRKPQIGDAIRRVVLLAASLADPGGRQTTGALGAGEQLTKRVHGQSVVSG